MADILIKPIVTEKSTKAADKLNRFGFVVDKNANKLEIKKAVEQMYGVTVKDVNTLVQAGKAKQRMTKTAVLKGQKSSFKKAFVTLAEGDNIDFYSSI
jgi:large subunit ribosomal protein L23